MLHGQGQGALRGEEGVAHGELLPLVVVLQGDGFPQGGGLPQLPHHAPQHQAGGQGSGKAVIQRDGRLGKGGVEEAALPNSGQGQERAK